MNVEDIACKISLIFSIQHDWRDPIYGVHVSPGSAETLARGGGITYHHIIACSLSNISAKNTKSVNMRWSYIVLHHCRFFETQCSTLSYSQISVGSLPVSHHVYYYWTYFESWVQLVRVRIGMSVELHTSQELTSARWISQYCYGTAQR